MSEKSRSERLEHGSRKGSGGLGAQGWKIWRFPIIFLAKNVAFLVSRGKNEISPVLPPLEKPFGSFWKTPLLALPPGKNTSDAHGLEVGFVLIFCEMLINELASRMRILLKPWMGQIKLTFSLIQSIAARYMRARPAHIARHGEDPCVLLRLIGKFGLIQGHRAALVRTRRPGVSKRAKHNETLNGNTTRSIRLSQQQRLHIRSSSSKGSNNAWANHRDMKSLDFTFRVVPRAFKTSQVIFSIEWKRAQVFQKKMRFLICL